MYARNIVSIIFFLKCVSEIKIKNNSTTNKYLHFFLKVNYKLFEIFINFNVYKTYCLHFYAKILFT